MSRFERLGNGGCCKYLGELLQSLKNHMLFQAVWAGHPRCVSRAIREGANVNGTDQRWTVRKEALKGNVNIVDTPRKHTDDTALSIAVRLPKYKCVDVLIRSGADVNKCNSHGETPLILAVKNGHSEYMESLIKAGARVNFRAGTLLWFSASRYGVKPLQTLLRAGITIDNIAPSTLNKYLRSLKAQAKKEVVLILAAAGEKIDDRKVRTPGYLKPRELSLMHLSRETIRNYLLLLDERKNLFIRIPQIELPPMMMLYLLHNVSLGDSSADISAIENI